MNRMKKIVTIFAIPACVALWACGNKEKQTEPMVIDRLPTVEESLPDTIATSIQNESPKEVENPSSQISSSSSSASSRSHESDDYDNMRGFDPASEDDMDDNGMSRYMENNDDEGWD